MPNMTTHQMLLKAMGFMLESPDNDLLTQYNAPFLTGVNAAYIDLRQMRGMDETWGPVTLDANKQFALSTLTDSVSELLAVAQYQDYSAAAGFAKAVSYNWDYINGGTVIVYDADASSTVYVKYRKLPDLLINSYPIDVVGPPAHAAGSDATSPLDLPPHDMDALIFKGLSEIASAKGDDMGIDKWEAKYAQARSAIRPVRKATLANNCDY